VAGRARRQMREALQRDLISVVNELRYGFF
jgi:hypothetical protein